MNKFIKKNVFLVGVLAIAAVGILLLLVMAAMKFLEMNEHRKATDDMRNRFAMLNRSQVPPFVKNIALVQKDAEGFTNRAENLKIYFGRVKEPALAIFVYDMNKQALDELAKAFEVFDKSDEFAKQREAVDAAHKKFSDSIIEFDKKSVILHKLEKELKVLESNEDTQEGKLRAVQEQSRKIADCRKELDELRTAIAGNFADAQAKREAFAAYINNCCNNENMRKLMQAADKQEDAKVVEFYRNICMQNVTPEMMKSVFRDFWQQEKEMLGPREQTYRRFVNERGATPDRPANDPSKPVLWDTKLWENAIEIFTREIQKVTPEEVDSRNREEIFLASLGLPRNLGQSASRLEAHSRKMADVIKNILDAGNVFNAGVIYGQKTLPQLKDNKGFVDVGDKGAGSQTTGRTGSAGENAQTGALLTANPADVIRHWEIVGDIAKRMVNANIDSLIDLSYINLAGDSSNENYKKFSYIITVVSREVEIREFLKQLNDSYKDHRIYVVKRFELKKQEDQIQIIIDKAQGVLDNRANNTDGNRNTGSGNMDDVSDAGKTVDDGTVFVEKGAYPECVAGRSTFCRATIVVDYIEFSKDVIN